MTASFRCFACGGTDHVKANCPRRTPRTTAPPGRALEGRTGTGKKNNVINLADRRPPPRRNDSEIADGPGWANQIRQSDPATFGPPACGDNSDWYDSKFRRQARLGRVHICVLRERARQQAAEFRSTT